jgi:hypothetical protein
MQLKSPLTPTLSPADGEREKLCRRGVELLDEAHLGLGLKVPSPHQMGIRVRVRGRADCIHTYG